jgi:hypothetical protein
MQAVEISEGRKPLFVEVGVHGKVILTWIFGK